MNADGDKENDTQPNGNDTGNATDAGRTAPAVQGQGQETDVPTQDTADQADPRTAAARTAGAGAVLPNKAAEDDPRRWGDQPGSYDHDAWLREQRPPHWG